eukprot:3025859-Lingulodinium_polyedra.AAC.1
MGDRHDRCGHRDVDFGRRTQAQPRQAQRSSTRCDGGKFIAGCMRGALANGVARGSPNYKGARGAAC